MNAILQYLGDIMSPRFFIYLLLLLFTTILGFLKNGRLQRRYKFLTILVAFVFISEVLTRVFSHTYGSSLSIYHVEAPILCILYWLVYNQSNKVLLVTIGYLLATVLCIVNTFYFQSINEFPSLSILGLSFMVVISAVLDFKRMLNSPVETKLSRTPDFWFNLGGIFFYAFTFFAFGLMNAGLWSLPFWVYDFIFFANMVLYLNYGLAIHLNARQKRNETNH